MSDTSEKHHERYIRPFDRDHLIYIAIMLLSLSLLLIFHREAQANPRPLRWVLLAVQILQQLLLYGSYLRQKAPLAVALPLHLSRLNSILCLIWLLSGMGWSMDILFYWGLFAYITFFFPSEVYPLSHPVGLSFVLNHTLTILVPWYAIIVSDWRPDLRGLHLAFAVFTVYLFFAAWLNPRIKGNYFYLVRRPLRSFDDIPFPKYFLLNLLVSYILFWLGYLLSRLILP